MTQAELLAELHIAVVIPAYEAASTIGAVLEAMPAEVRVVVVVDDGSSDGTADVVGQFMRADPRVILQMHELNRGIGAAMRTGYRRALDEGAEIIVKMDSDGQMDAAYLPALVLPVALGEADYAKGNRFLRPEALHQMPRLRLIGNAILSFVTKLSSGYWNLLDPTNGFTAISRDVLASLALDRLEDRYFFESSMLIELQMLRAVVVDVPIPSRYGSEESHLSVARNAFSFALKHVRYGVRRVLYRHFLFDFSPVSLLLALSLPLLAFGIGFGARSWLRSVLYGTPATAGTVMLAAFTTAAGAFCLVQALIYDVLSVPQRPLTPPRLARLRRAPAGRVAP